MAEEPIQRLSDFCGIAEEDLLVLKDQLSKVIAVKKKMYSDNSNNTVLRQTADVLKTIENLEKIDSKLPEAISEIKELCQKVRLLLRSEAGVQYSASGLVQENLGK